MKKIVVNNAIIDAVRIILPDLLSEMSTSVKDAIRHLIESLRLHNDKKEWLKKFVEIFESIVGPMISRLEFEETGQFIDLLFGVLNEVFIKKIFPGAKLELCELSSAFFNLSFLEAIDFPELIYSVMEMLKSIFQQAEIKSLIITNKECKREYKSFLERLRETAFKMNTLNMYLDHIDPKADREEYSKFHCYNVRLGKNLPFAKRTEPVFYFVRNI